MEDFSPVPADDDSQAGTTSQFVGLFIICGGATISGYMCAKCGGHFSHQPWDIVITAVVTITLFFMGRSLGSGEVPVGSITLLPIAYYGRTVAHEVRKAGCSIAGSISHSICRRVWHSARSSTDTYSFCDHQPGWSAYTCSVPPPNSLDHCHGSKAMATSRLAWDWNDGGSPVLCTSTQWTGLVRGVEICAWTQVRRVSDQTRRDRQGDDPSQRIYRHGPYPLPMATGWPADLRALHLIGAESLCHSLGLGPGEQ